MEPIQLSRPVFQALEKAMGNQQISRQEWQQIAGKMAQDHQLSQQELALITQLQDQCSFTVTDGKKTLLLEPKLVEFELSGLQAGAVVLDQGLLKNIDPLELTASLLSQTAGRFSAAEIGKALSGDAKAQQNLNKYLQRMVQHLSRALTQFEEQECQEDAPEAVKVLRELRRALEDLNFSQPALLESQFETFQSELRQISAHFKSSLADPESVSAKAQASAQKMLSAVQRRFQYNFDQHQDPSFLSLQRGLQALDIPADQIEAAYLAFAVPPHQTAELESALQTAHSQAQQLQALAEAVRSEIPDALGQNIAEALSATSQALAEFSQTSPSNPRELQARQAALKLALEHHLAFARDNQSYPEPAYRVLETLLDELMPLANPSGALDAAAHVASQSLNRPGFQAELQESLPGFVLINDFMHQQAQALQEPLEQALAQMKQDYGPSHPLTLALAKARDGLLILQATGLGNAQESRIQKQALYASCLDKAREFLQKAGAQDTTSPHDLAAAQSLFQALEGLNLDTQTLRNTQALNRGLEAAHQELSAALQNLDQSVRALLEQPRERQRLEQPAPGLREFQNLVGLEPEPTLTQQWQAQTDALLEGLELAQKYIRNWSANQDPGISLESRPEWQLLEKLKERVQLLREQANPDLEALNLELRGLLEACDPAAREGLAELTRELLKLKSLEQVESRIVARPGQLLNQQQAIELARAQALQDPRHIYAVVDDNGAYQVIKYPLESDFATARLMEQAALGQGNLVFAIHADGQNPPQSAGLSLASNPEPGPVRSLGPQDLPEVRTQETRSHFDPNTGDTFETTRSSDVSRATFASNPRFQETMNELSPLVLDAAKRRYGTAKAAFESWQNNPEQLMAYLVSSAKTLPKRYDGLPKLAELQRHIQRVFDLDKFTAQVLSYKVFEMLKPHSNPTILPALKEDLARSPYFAKLQASCQERAQDMQQRMNWMEILKNPAAASLEDLQHAEGKGTSALGSLQIFRGLVSLDQASYQAALTDLRNDLVFAALESYPGLRDTLYKQKGFQLDRNVFPPKELDQLPDRGNPADFHNNPDEMFFAYGAAVYSEKTFGETVMGLLEGLPIVTSIVEANRLADYEADYAAGLRNREVVDAQQKAAVMANISTSIAIGSMAGGQFIQGTSRLTKLTEFAFDATTTLIEGVMTGKTPGDMALSLFSSTALNKVMAQCKKLFPGADHLRLKEEQGKLFLSDGTRQIEVHVGLDLDAELPSYTFSIGGETYHMPLKSSYQKALLELASEMDEVQVKLKVERTAEELRLEAEAAGQEPK